MQSIDHQHAVWSLWADVISADSRVKVVIRCKYGRGDVCDSGGVMHKRIGKWCTNGLEEHKKQHTAVSIPGKGP